MKPGDLVSLRTKSWPSSNLWSDDGRKVVGSLKIEEVCVVLHSSKEERTTLVLTPAGTAGWILATLLKLCDRK